MRLAVIAALALVLASPTAAQEPAEAPVLQPIAPISPQVTGTAPAPPPLTPQQPSATRFDLDCVGTVEAGGASQAWGRRFSVDLVNRRFAPQDGQTSVRDILEIAPSTVRLTAWMTLDRNSGELRIETEGARVVAQCSQQGFTQFPERRF
jgi:hypothetical protein